MPLGPLDKHQEAISSVGWKAKPWPPKGIAKQQCPTLHAHTFVSNIIGSSLEMLVKASEDDLQLVLAGIAALEGIHFEQCMNAPVVFDPQRKKNEQ